jgi:hypothetical protein
VGAVRIVLKLSFQSFVHSKTENCLPSVITIEGIRSKLLRDWLIIMACFALFLFMLTVQITPHKHENVLKIAG